MKKKYLSGILFIVMIMISECTLVNKSEAAVKLPSSDAKIYQNRGTVSQNNSIKLLAQKKQQPMVQTIFKQGNKGSKIKEIQQKLNKFGYKLYADGDFGRLTYYAVIDFQMRNKLNKDGIVGSSTLKKLNMKPTSQTMYKQPVIQKYKPKVPVSNNSLEKTINSKNSYSSTAYFIWIDLPRQKVNIFKGSNKKWHLIRSMACSSGKSRTPTVKGNFTVGSKGSYFISDGGARCKYYTQIRGNYLFHSVLYDRRGNYVIDNTLGVPVSHGCVRLALKDAKFIYDNIPARTAIWSK